MKNLLPFHNRRLGLLVLLGTAFVLFLVSRATAQSPSQDKQQAPNPSPTTTQTEAQKKAAERRKRFEEQKALLDGGGSAAAGAGAAKQTPRTDSVFWMDLIGLNMVANQSQEIHVWDMYNNDVSARVSWSLSDSGVVDMAVKGHAMITAKMPGTVKVIGTIDGHIVEAIVTVYRGEKLPPGIGPSVYGQIPKRTGGRRNVTTVTVDPN